MVEAGGGDGYLAYRRGMPLYLSSCNAQREQGGLGGLVATRRSFIGKFKLLNPSDFSTNNSQVCLWCCGVGELVWQREDDRVTM